MLIPLHHRGIVSALHIGSLTRWNPFIMKAFANLAASTQDPNAVSLFSWWCGWMDSNQRLSARQADVLTHYTTTTLKWCLPARMISFCFLRGMVSVMFQSQALLTGKRSSIYTPFFIRRLDIIYISNNFVPGRRLERPIFALGERCISIVLPRHHYILTTNTVPNYFSPVIFL